MEPRIQYAQTKDGVSIAFWTLGEGMPFVVLTPLAMSHIQLEWEMPEYRRWYERMARNRKLVRYDSRGLGLSQRNVTDLSLDAYVLDLEAVVERLGLERIALFAVFNSGTTGIAYAVRHPGRVSHLILWCARAADFDPSGPSEQAEWESLLIETNWELFTETMVHHLVGWSAGDSAHRIAQLMREGVTREHMQAYRAVYRSRDATALLPEVKSPTLVVHRRQVPWPDLETARVLASQIPDARLVVVEGESIAPFLGDTESVMKTIDEFLGLEMEEEATVAGAPAPGAVHTILFTDVEGSTSLTQRLGDARAREILRNHERMVREALNAHGGSEVKTMGDGFMASFSSATRALECAIAMQRAFAEHNESAQEPIRVRIGLNAGEPIAEEEDLFGTAVQLAARICAHAEPGEILAPIVVRELAAGKAFLFADRGDAVLRGFEDPVRLFEVRWREEG
jgi:class 3 adenylate cyclase/pimeloyl-ACP methyl ester carboxylesterase